MAFLTIIFAAPMLRAEQVTLKASDGSGTSSLNSADEWNNNAAPSGTNDYFTSIYFLRTPGDSGNTTYTFAGNSLTLQPPSGQGAPMRSILYKGGSGDTIIINNLTNAGGVINNGGSGNVTATFSGNQMTIISNSTIIADQGPAIIGYPIVSSVGICLTNTGSTQSGVHSVTYTGSLSGFMGKLLLVNLNGSLGMVLDLNSGSSNLGNPATPEPDQITIGLGCALTDNAGLTFNNSNGGVTLIANGSINADATTLMAEPITDLTNGVSSHSTLTAGGTGTLVLGNPNNNYTGGTTISSGLLQLGGNNAVPVGLLTDNTTFDLNTYSDAIDGLTGTGTVETSGGGTPTLTIGAAGGTATFSGNILENSGGTLNVLKTGAGTETFSTGYGYIGTTTVAGGALDLITSAALPSTPGDMVVSNGAVLNVNATTGTALPVRNLVTAANSTLNLALTPTASGISATSGLTFQNNATNNFSFGTLTANPTAPAITAAGSISAPGANIVITISALGLKPGTFTLIKYSGTPLASVANFTLALPPGVVAVLVDNSNNDSIDVDITSTPNQLAWNGVAGDNWDLSTPNWTNIVDGGITVFQQYTNNGVISGDSVLFDDTLTNTSPEPTNVYITEAFFTFPVVENSTLPYSLSGPGGILGATSLVKSNSGSWTVLTSNAFTGGTFVYGGTLVISNDNALGTNNGAVQLNGGTLQYIGSTTNNLRAFSLPVTSYIAVSTNNTVRLGGVITGVGLNKQDNGTLVLAGTNSFSGSFFAKQGITTIPSGSVTNSNYDDVGQDTNDAATLNIAGGSLGTSSDFNAGDLGASVGTVNLSSGSLIVNALFVGSANAAGSTASGTINQSGGTLTEVSTAVGEFCIGGRTSTSGVGVYNMSGGTLNAGAGIRVGSTGIGTLNQSAGTINAVQGLNIARIGGSFGTNNLNGGTLNAYNVTSSTVSNAVFNFNGGILKAAFTNATPWVTNLTQMNVLAGGAIIDDGGGTPLFGQVLTSVSPTGGLTKQGAGTLTMTMPNAFTGPITNNGGTLFLDSASTYPGAVQINAGTIQITPASLLQGPIAIQTNASLAIVQTGSSTVTVGSLTFNGSATTPGGSLTVTLTSANVGTVPFVNAGTLTLTGTNTINVSGNVPLGATAILKYAGTIAGSGNITNLILPQGAGGYLSNNAAGSTLYVVVTNSGPGLVWTGTNNVAGHTNVWDILSTTNWLVNGKPTWYQQYSIPGDAVTFNDSGSGTVLLSNNVGPANMLISNSVKTYTFSGNGLITGPTTAVTKLGTASVIINLTNNNYSGNTTISNGTLQIGTASAISPNANLAIGAGATLEVAGSSPTSGDLSGSGLIDNNSGLPVAVTVGSSGGGTWNGTVTNSGGGGFALTKNGTGTWIVGGSNYLNNGQPFTFQCLVDGGTLVLTNGGLISIPTLELRIADGNALNSATSSVVVAGGTLIVTNNPLSVGVNSNNASGTLIVNSGTVVAGTGGGGVFAGSPNYIVVGGNGATGVMTVNGGQVIDGQELWLGQNTGASGTLNLNGGVLEVASIANSGTPTTSVADFNGGTLEGVTNDADFLDPAVTYMIMSNGFVLNDGGFTLNIPGILQAGDSFNGGFVKNGAGVVYMDGYGSSYTGTTTVNAGTLAGIGSIPAGLVVAPAGALGAGDAGAVGALTVSGNLTLQGAATLRINVTGGSPSSDEIVGISTANYGGTLVISNITTDPTVLTNGETFQLFSATTGTGNFAHIVGSPGAGLSYVFYPATGILGVTNAVVVKSVPRITHISVSGTTLSISGTNGTPTGNYVVLDSTNVALPVAQWTPLLTNAFDGSGNFNLSTNILSPGHSVEFFLLSQ